MEREKRALDAQPYTHQGHGDDQRDLVFPCHNEQANRFFDIAHQKMASQVIHDTEAKEQKSGTQQAHNHVADGRLDGATHLADHNQAAGGDGVDFHEDVSRKHIVCVDQCQQGAKQKIYEDIIQIMFAFHHLAVKLVRTARHGKIHDNAEEESHARFQHARPDFVAPGGGEMSHPVDERLACVQKIYEQYRRQDTCRKDDDTVYGFCRLCGQNGADRTGKQAQKDGKKREITNKVHLYLPSFLSSVEISSRSSVWYLV